MNRHADLPVAWDGAPLTWTPWEPEPVMFLCPPRPTPCPACTQLLTRRRLVSRGTTSVEVGTGRLLYAYRCQQPLFRSPGGPCNHDQVVDLHTGESWDLDPTDYGPTGSWPEDLALFGSGGL